MYAYIGLAYYEQDLDNEYKERTGYDMNGFYQAQQEYESKMFDPFGYDEEDYEDEYEDPEVDRRLEDRADELGNLQSDRMHEEG